MAKRYTEEEIERGLAALALCAGNAAQAQRVLADEGHKIPARTLSAWLEKHPARYVAVQERIYRQVQGKIAGESERLAQRAVTITDRLFDRLESEVDEIPARDIAGAIRNTLTGLGISVDKFRLLRDQPAVVVEHRNLDELRRKWEAQGLLVDSTAVELPHGRYKHHQVHEPNGGPTPSAAELPAGDDGVPPEEQEPAA